MTSEHTQSTIPALSIRAYQGSGGQVVEVAGDGPGCSEEEDFRGELLPLLAGPGTVVLDLAGVGFCDSSGLRVLMEAERRPTANGGTLRPAGPTAPVRRLLSLSKADAVLEIFPDVRGALAR